MVMSCYNKSSIKLDIIPAQLALLLWFKEKLFHYVEMGRRRAVWGGEAGGRKGESPQAPDRVGVML